MEIIHILKELECRNINVTQENIVNLALKRFDWDEEKTNELLQINISAGNILQTQIGRGFMYKLQRNKDHKEEKVTHSTLVETSFQEKQIATNHEFKDILSSIIESFSYFKEEMVEEISCLNKKIDSNPGKSLLVEKIQQLEKEREALKSEVKTKQEIIEKLISTRGINAKQKHHQQSSPKKTVSKFNECDDTPEQKTNAQNTKKL